MLPLNLPRKALASRNNRKILAADIGGTKVNMGIFLSENGKLTLQYQASYPSADYASFSDILHLFIKEVNNGLPDCLSFGVAGPVMNKKVGTTNLPWQLDIDLLQQQTGVEEVYLINDLEATAYGLTQLTEEELPLIFKEKELIPGNAAIIAPGTGLGEAGLFWDGNLFHPFPTEGGHCSFSPKTKTDILLYQKLEKKYKHVSWEHVISGPGIVNIYEFLRDELKIDEPVWLKQQLEEMKDDAKVISENALNNACELCTKTMELFITYMAHEASNLALKLKATGGLFLAGGIPPKIRKLIEQPCFYKAFTTHTDRMEDLMQAVPIKIVLNSKTALLGAACYGAYGDGK